MRAAELDRRSRELLRDAHYLCTVAMVYQRCCPRDRRLKRLGRETVKLADDALELRNEIRSTLEETFLEVCV